MAENKRVYKQLAQVYETSGWIERIGRGAYKRTGDELSWEGGLYALQQLQNLPIHVGGRMALDLQGFAHYVKMDGNQVDTMEDPGSATYLLVSKVRLGG